MTRAAAQPSDSDFIEICFSALSFPLCAQILHNRAIFQRAFTAIALRNDKSDQIWSFAFDRSVVLRRGVPKRPRELNAHGVALKDLGRPFVREVSISAMGPEVPE
jgi:hypothetical protein